MSVGTLERLLRPSYRIVTVAGVEVEMFEDGKASYTAPARVPLVEWAESGWYTAEQITRLHLAGIGALPLYESQARADGVRWGEVG